MTDCEPLKNYMKVVNVEYKDFKEILPLYYKASVPLYNYIEEKQIPPSTTTTLYFESHSERIMYILSVIVQFNKGIYNQQFIYNLFRAYIEWSHEYLRYIIKEELKKIFSIPGKCHFSGKDVHNLYEYAKCKNILQKDLSFCETLYTFFMAYSKKRWKYLSRIQSSSDNIINNHFSSSLIGLATGDALGFMVEGRSREESEKYVKDVIETKKYECGINKNFGIQNGKIVDRYSWQRENWIYKLGQYTDDTQLCRELIRNIKIYGTFNSKDYSKRLITLFMKSGLLRPNTRQLSQKKLDKLNIDTGIVGYGSTTLNSTQCLADGLSWEQSGLLFKKNKSTGNGGCMKAAPLGILFFEQPEKMREIASKQSIGTHGNSKCKATSVMVAEAARLACESTVCSWSHHLPFYPEMFCDRLKVVVDTYDQEVGNLLLQVPSWLEEKDEQKLVNIITSAGKELGDSLWHNGNVISASTVQTAFFSLICFLKNPDSYEDAISMAIRGGGDTDTTAAICGAITAARTTRVLKNIYINDQEKWNEYDLRNLAISARNSVWINRDK